MPARHGVVVVGSFNVDHAWRCPELPAAGATLAGEYASGPGGKGFNQAVAAARAGAPTTFLCALGDDAGAALARSLAAADGIDLRAAPSAEPTGTAGIFVDATGRNCIVIGAGANADLGAGFVEVNAERVQDAAVVLAQLESPLASIQRALELGRAGGATTVLNPAPANAVSTRGLLDLVDLLTPNETEFAALLARHCDIALAPDAVATTTDDVLHTACRRLLPTGTVVVTLGAAGCFVSHPGSGGRGDARTHYRVAAEPVAAVDTTGAGVAFNGALAASLAVAARPFEAHIRFANAYAGCSTQARGAATAMPHWTAG
jgi:ribokinase